MGTSDVTVNSKNLLTYMTQPFGLERFFWEIRKPRCIRREKMLLPPSQNKDSESSNSRINSMGV